MKTTAIVLSAGSGKRMKADVAKQYLPLNGKPVIYYSLKTFEDSFIDEVILVAGADDLEYCRKEIVDKYGLTKVKKIVAGGKERYHSVLNGLRASDACDYVFIHDGARPFITKDILEHALSQVKEHAACVVGVPVKDTIKITDDEGYVNSTPRRDRLYQIQTPQIFSYDLIRDAYEELEQKEEELLQQGVVITDDAMIVEALKKTPVKVIDGSYVNIKLTTPEDFLYAETLVKSRF